MDKGVENTQRIVVTGAILLGVFIVFLIGYSLYVKAKRAEGELANKIELDKQTKQSTQEANISVTGEAKNAANFTYDGLIQKRQEEATTTNFEIVNETVPVEIPEEPSTPEEDPVPPEEPTEPEPTPIVTAPKPQVNDDQPLSFEEIQRIRQLPIDDSPSGNLQTSLEEESNGQYKARY